MYLFDANVIISSNRLYYPVTRFPEYWDWLAHQIEQGRVRTVREVYDEILTDDDSLREWLDAVEDEFVLSDTTYLYVVADVIAHYASDLTESEYESTGKDSFLIAAAKKLDACVVTKEVSKPKRKRGNRKIPDVCADAGVRCINDHSLIAELDFRTDWHAVAR